MAETPKVLSVSFRQDAGNIEHNSRIFDEARTEYNSARTCKDRIIENYYEHIKRGKKEKLFQEVVVIFGNSEMCGVGSDN